MPMTISLVTDTREACPLVVKLDAARMTDWLDILRALACSNGQRLYAGVQ